MMVLIESAEGAPRHTHPGLEMTYILDGEAILSVDGRPDQALKPGDSFEVPARCRTVCKSLVTSLDVRSGTT